MGLATLKAAATSPSSSSLELTIVAAGAPAALDTAWVSACCAAARAVPSLRRSRDRPIGHVHDLLDVVVRGELERADRDLGEHVVVDGYS